MINLRLGLARRVWMRVGGPANNPVQLDVHRSRLLTSGSSGVSSGRGAVSGRFSLCRRARRYRSVFRPLSSEQSAIELRLTMG